jgi:hypothetical protein
MRTVAHCDGLSVLVTVTVELDSEAESDDALVLLHGALVNPDAPGPQ